MLQNKLSNGSSQPFQGCGPNNKETEDPWPTDYATCPMRGLLLHMHTAETKTTFNDTACVTIKARAEPIYC